jgi:hypothetical protein
MAENFREATRAVAAGRFLLGTSFCLAPALAGGWVGDAASTQGTRMVIRSLGARDAALGLGTLASLDDPAQLRRWLVASSVCDATDFVATLAGPAAPARSVVAVIAAGAAAAGIGLAVAAGR